jgi:hypothetical protein
MKTYADPKPPMPIYGSPRLRGSGLSSVDGTITCWGITGDLVARLAAIRALGKL